MERTHEVVKPKLPHVIVSVDRECLDDVEWLYDMIYAELGEKNVPYEDRKQFLRDYHTAKHSQDPDKALMKMYRSWVAIRVKKDGIDAEEEETLEESSNGTDGTETESGPPETAGGGETNGPDDSAGGKV